MDDSIFGKKVLKLDSVCWMNPHAYIENVPADWDKISIAIFHYYFGGCYLPNTDINLFAAPQAQVWEQGEDCMRQIWTKRFSQDEIADMPKDKALREELATTFDVPEDVTSQGPYVLKLEVKAACGNWKRDWGFEGFGICK